MPFDGEASVTHHHVTLIVRYEDKSARLRTGRRLEAESGDELRLYLLYLQTMNPDHEVTIIVNGRSIEVSISDVDLCVRRQGPTHCHPGRHSVTQLLDP